MATLLVRKDGSGTHTTIQSAIYSASVGDVIDIGPGTFVENIDLYKNGITLQGAGKSQTIVQGVLETNLVKNGTWLINSNTLSFPGGTSGFLVGRLISASGIPANTRIVQVNPTSVVISANTTIAKTNLATTMGLVEATLRMRSVNPVIKDMKLIGLQPLATRAAVDNGTIMMRVASAGSSTTSGYLIENCEITANGDSAIMTEPGIAGGTVTNCVINGKTYVGDQPAQVHGFSTLQVVGNVLTSTTIEFPAENVGIDMVINSTLLTTAGLVDTGTKITAINGNVVTLNKALLSGVGTSQNFTLNNIQFNVPNVSRQLVVFQSGNTSPVTFTNNTVNGQTGAGASYSYNTAVTVDPVNSIVTGNTLDGFFKVGYALRVRGAGSTVENNINMILGDKNNSGYLIGIISGMDIGTNFSVSAKMIETTQLIQGGPVKVIMDKVQVKTITKVVDSPVFSDEANWKLVTYVFKKVGSSQRLVSSFRDFSGEKNLALKTGMSSGDQFEIHKIIISKADRTLLVIKRSEIANPATYDFTLL